MKSGSIKSSIVVFLVWFSVSLAAYSPDSSLGITAVPASMGSAYTSQFDRYTKVTAPNGKAIHIVAQSKVSNEQIVRARNVLEHFLADFGGSAYGAHKDEVANKMANNGAILLLLNGSDNDNNDPTVEGQALYQEELVVEGASWYINNEYDDHRDATFEEILHLVHDYGIGVDGHNSFPGALPAYQSEIRSAQQYALSNNLWGMGESEWINELTQENSLTQEYLAAVIDSYYGLWGAYSGSLGMWGLYIAKTRSDIQSKDTRGWGLIGKFFHPYLTYNARIDSSFSGTFYMNFSSSLKYTHKSQYLKDITLTGSKNTKVRGNGYDNSITGNSGDNTVKFSGSYSQYTLSKSNGVITVGDNISGRDGTDTLTAVEYIQFSDRTVSADDVGSGGGSPGGGGTIALSANRLDFAAVSGVTPGSQTFSVNNSGSGTLSWTLSTSASWLQCAPTSGSDGTTVMVSLNLPGGPGIYTGTITVSDVNATNSPQTLAVNLKVYGAGYTEAPFGQFATPLDGATVAGSIAVTGWVLDDLGVDSVKIYRDGDGLVYIGDAVFVRGSRPDVETQYPGYPNNDRAGWGYMLLTNFFPNGGNGQFNLYAIATDLEGNQTTLGVKSIDVDNANAVKPFGAIDTPTQGGTASGSSYVNWGWVLTPQPGEIPTSGSSINVFVDGVNVGNPIYNIYLSDIAGLFPGYANSNGAIGYFYLDTTGYDDGLHTIQWVVTDNLDRTDGIGSRYFTIANGNRSAVQRVSAATAAALTVENHRTVAIDEMEHLILPLPGQTVAGCMKVGNQLERLPVGSTLDTVENNFLWLPGPGFVGRFHLVFVVKDLDGKLTRMDVTVDIYPKDWHR